MIGGVVAGHALLGREPGGVGVLRDHLPVGVHRYPRVWLQLHIVRLGLKEDLLKNTRNKGFYIELVRLSTVPIYT